MRGIKTSRVVVAVNFILHRIQPYKERAHAGFDFKGDIDGTQERTKNLAKEVVLHRAIELFTPNISYTVLGQPKPFNCSNSRPQVKISTVVPSAFCPVPAPSSGLIRLWKDPLVGTGGVLLRHDKDQLAKGSGLQADHSARGRCRQHLV